METFDADSPNQILLKPLERFEEVFPLCKPPVRGACFSEILYVASFLFFWSISFISPFSCPFFGVQAMVFFLSV